MNPMLAHRSDSMAGAVNPDSRGTGRLGSLPEYVPTQRVLIRNMYPFAGSNKYPLAGSLFSNMYPFGGAKKDKNLIRIRREGSEVFSPGAPAWPGANLTLSSKISLEVWGRESSLVGFSCQTPSPDSSPDVPCPDRAPVARLPHLQIDGSSECLSS